LDILSVSVDHYDESLWDEAKHIPGISKKAKELIKAAKEHGIKTYELHFLIQLGGLQTWSRLCIM
jgi:MoaA/NifB/PqqE/SkfB family radical SAM enzyme